MDGRALILRGVPGLESVSPEALLVLAEHFGEQFLPSGAWLCREGDASAALYVLAEGHLGVHRRGQRVVVVGPGAVVGHVGALSGQPRSAGLRAEGAVTLLVLSAGVAQALVAAPEAGAPLRRALIVAHVRQLREATRVLVEAAQAGGGRGVEGALLAARGSP